MKEHDPGEEERFCDFCGESSYESDLSGCDCCSAVMCPECQIECETECGYPMIVCENCVKKESNHAD